MRPFFFFVFGNTWSIFIYVQPVYIFTSTTRYIHFTSHKLQLANFRMEAPNTNSYNNNNNMMSVEIGMEVHRVEAPPHRSTIQKLKTRLKETFFPDDPLRQFKGQTLGKKWILGAQYVFPILKWGPEYNLKLFKSDIVSGLTIASLAIPQVQLQLLLIIYICSINYIINDFEFLIYQLITLFLCSFIFPGNKLCQAC